MRKSWFDVQFSSKNWTLTYLCLYSYSGTVGFFFFFFFLDKVNTSSQFRVICIEVLFLVGLHCSYCFSVLHRWFTELQSNGTNIYLSSVEGSLPQSPRHFAWRPLARVSPTLRPSYFSNMIAAVDEQTTTGNSTALIAEMWWSTPTWFRALSRLVISVKIRHYYLRLKLEI